MSVCVYGTPFLICVYIITRIQICGKYVILLEYKHIIEPIIYVNINFKQQTWNLYENYLLRHILYTATMSKFLCIETPLISLQE